MTLDSISRLDPYRTTAAVKDNGLLVDNVAHYPTPEGLLLSLMPAGLLPRLSAWFIDLLIRGMIIIVISAAAAFLETAGTGIIAISYFLITWLYPVYFEVYRDGMTPGKKRQGIYVCHDDGTPISLSSSMTRNLLRVADFLPIGFGVGALTMMFTKRSQRIGDIVAGTLVVYQHQNDLKKLYKSIYGTFSIDANNLATLDNPFDTSTSNAASTNHLLNDAFDAASPLFFYPLHLNEQQALVSYKERAGFLSEGRQLEITSILSPLITVQRESPAAKKAAILQAVIQKANVIQGQSLLGSTAYMSHGKRPLKDQMQLDGQKGRS